MTDSSDRKTFRFAAFVEADLYRQESIISIGKAYITNISAAGIGFRSDIACLKDQSLQADIILPSGEIVNVNFRIVRANKIENTNDYGASFENNPESVMWKIEEFVKVNLSKAP